jgi:hypothetical protein
MAALRLAKERLTECQERIALLFKEHAAGQLPAPVWRKLAAELNDEHAAAEEAVERIVTEQRAAERTRARTVTLVERVQTELDRIKAGGVDLEGKRRILGDLLQGGRLTIVEWIDRTKEPSPRYCTAGAPDATCGIDLVREAHCWRCCEHGHRAATCPRYGRVARIEFPAVAGLAAAVARTDRLPLALKGDAVAHGKHVRLRVDRRTSRVGGFSDRVVTSTAALRGDLDDAVWEEPVPR